MKKTQSGKKISFENRSRSFSVKSLVPLVAAGLVLALAVGLFSIAVPAGAQKKVSAEVPTLRFSEVQSDNGATIPSAGGEAPDWIEIENTGSRALSMKGVSMLIDEKVNRMFNFPDVTLNPGEYLLVYADGSTVASADGALHAPFRLPASGGSTLYLFDLGNHLLDTVLLPEMEMDQSYARTGDDAWEITGNPTPGADNRSGGPAAGIAMDVVSGDLEISEAMSANNAYFADEDGAFHDYVELHNTTGRSVNLGAYWLSDDNTLLKKWRLPDVNLPAGGYIALHCSGLDRKADANHLHTSFKLASTGEALFLTDDHNNTISAVTLPALLGGQAYSLSGGAWTTALEPTPNRENTVDGAALQNRELLSGNTLGVRINEAMAAPVDENYDWVELYNASATAVDLSGYGLSDEVAQPRKWQFPAGTVIQPQGYLAVFLTGSEGASNDKYLCAPFALAADGGYAVSLSTPQGEVVDMLYLPVQGMGISYGRGASGENGYLSVSTPMAANAGECYRRRVDSARVSVPGGLFTTGDTFSVSLSAEEGARIYYTLDCTDPSEASTLYTGAPIPVSSTTILRTRVYKDGCLPSIMDSQSYLYDVKGATEMPYVVSLVSDPAGLYSDETGIMVPGPNAEKEFPHGSYGRGANYWMDWERESHIELFTNTGETAVSQECGIKIHGRNSRAYDLKPIKVIARAAYGDGDFSYPIFSDRPYDEYRAFILRYTGQDHQYAFMRDPVLTELCADTDVMYQEAEECICYINGEYYSAMYIREHMSPYSICRENGWEGMEDDIDLIKAGTGVMQGSNDSYAALREWLLANDPTTQQAYETIDAAIDIDNFIDYAIMMAYVSPRDTVNVKRYRNPYGDGKWRWILYDVDNSMRGDADGFALMAQGTNGILFEACMKNPTIRDRFLKRMNERLATTLRSANTVPMIKEQYERLQPVIDDYLAVVGMDRDTWESRVKGFAGVVKSRPAQMLKHCVNYLGLTEAEFNSYFKEALAEIEAYSAANP